MAGDSPPPGAGEPTVTDTTDAAAMSAAGIAAVSSPALTNVVRRFTPPIRTTDDGTNPLPPT